MASFKKSPTHKFSRVKSDLAELQRWWPAFIKDDGVLGISVDPVLFKTSFSTYEETDLDESQVAGIRVEAIMDNGTDVSGTEPTIVISGSGSFTPKCTINHADGTSTDIMLIAPDRSQVGANTVTMNFTDNLGASQTGAVDIDADTDDEAMNGTRTGPYPVFMTVQELAEIIDTYRHIGAVDSAKKAFLPHGLYSDASMRGLQFPAAIEADPRSTSSPLPADSPYRATVFMPMMLDNNQFSKDIAGSTTLWGGHHSVWNKNGITRYNPDPEGADAATIDYKKYGTSGDHQKNSNKARTANSTAVWTSQDSSDCPAPKYRMVMALACFLKDGTYSLNNGTIIPYSYDASRTLGGVHTDTMYLRWDGQAGFGTNTISNQENDTPAGIYPLFDFVQGPITPRAQGSNWTHAVLADHFPSSTEPLRYEIPPNTRPISITAISVVAKDSIPIPAGGHFGRQLCVRVKDVISSTEPNQNFPLAVGQAIYLEGMDGVLGSGTDMRKATGNIWPTRYDKRRKDNSPSVGPMDCNGWWLVSGVNTTEFTNEIEYRFNVHPDLLPVTTEYNPTGQACAGRQGGPEISFNTFFANENSTNIPIDGAIEPDMATNNQNLELARQPTVPITDFETADGRAGSPAIGTGYQAGMGQGDLNVPVASSRNDTAPARVTIAEHAIIDNLGEYSDNRPVPRSIHIQTLGVTPNESIPSAPPIITQGTGSLRVPAPLGHDLCTRYNNSSKDGIDSNGLPSLTAGTDTVWRLRSDISRANDNEGLSSGKGGPDRWAWRGVSAPLWSCIDGNTGRHAWDYIKPTGWTFGRNRPWPAHERLGTRLSMSPSLLGGASPYTGWGTGGAYHVAPNTETSLIGTSEIGCSPIFLDMEMKAFIPNQPDRMVMIDFDMNDADGMLGRHHMIHQTNNRDMGFGFRPRWDATNPAGVYRRDVFALADGTAATGIAPTAPITSISWTSAASAANAVAGNNANWAGFPMDAVFGLEARTNTTSNATPPYPTQTTNNRPSIWFLGSSPHWTSDQWVGKRDGDLTLPSVGGFGRMGTGFGQGPSFSYSEGTNTVRSVFTSGGMTLLVNGTSIGTDISADEPVWGLQFKACSVFAFSDRRPFWLTDGSTATLVPTEYDHLAAEEHVVHGQRSGTPFTAARHPVDRLLYEVGVGTYGPWANVTSNFPREFPVAMASIKDTVGRMTRPDAPALNQSNVDFSIDEITMRQIPTPAMLPFTVDTLTQSVPSGTAVARFTSLIIEADNISVDDKRKVTVTLLEPPVSGSIAQEASTVISGYDNIDPDFLGGIGQVDLSGLPASVVSTGFVVRFNFFIPSSEDTTLHPIDWSSLPIVRNYTIYYDHKPTSQAQVIGNTYDGSLANTATGDLAFTTKVGHIISLRMSGATTDPDRKISFLKADFGDGTVTDWIAVETPATSVTYDISHVYSSKPASGTYNLVVYSMDDNANESAASTAIVATIVAAEPVAILRAVPSMVRAGQALRLDGADSYTIDTETNLAAYAWTFGDGSTGVSGASSYQDHTYATAGEFMATLIVTDNLGTSSPTAKSVVKVLPATLVVPLNLSTKPSSFRRTRSASLTRTPILDAVYPEVTDMGQRGDEFTLSGMFLQGTQDTDIAFMEELLLSGALVQFQYQDVNYEGVADAKEFTGRMVSFDYNRQGGNVDRTPYTAVFVREAGLGA